MAHVVRSSLWALLVVILLVALAWASTANVALTGVLAIGVTYAAMATFIVGVVARVVRWARAPVPFRIPTTCGQQRSLPWLRAQPLENPSSTLGVVGRMLLEIFLFRSLFRNTKSRMGPGRRFFHFSDKALWLGAITFHACLAVVLLRHLRLLLDPVPSFVPMLEAVDGFFHIGVPEVNLSTLGLCAALVYLTWRRFGDPVVRRISLLADYFPLMLLLGIAATGVTMRHFDNVDVISVKAFMVGLVSFRPHGPGDLPVLFVVHLTLVNALLFYFPFSKLSHMMGIVLSPTRNLANTSRMRRHVNPWNPAVQMHTYDEWEKEFLPKLEAAGIPLDDAGSPGASAEHPPE